MRAEGESAAREEIVARYVPLMWSIFARFQLSDHDREDVGPPLGGRREPCLIAGTMRSFWRRWARR
jgi:hypothetical protein